MRKPASVMPTHLKSLIVAVLASGTVLFLLLTPLPESWHGQWQAKFFDLGHVPLFAGLTLLLWWGLRGPWRWPVLISLTLAAVAELVQGYFGRSGNLPDFIRGALGVALAVVIVHAWRGRGTVWRLAGHGLLVLVLLAWPISDSGPYLLDAYEGWRSFPTLADFRGSREVLRWDCQQAILARIADPDKPGVWQGRLEFLPGPADYPGAALQPIIRDFTRFRRLCWLLSTEADTLDVVFSVRSRPDGASPSSHYQFERTFAAGEHRVTVDLAAVASKARPGRLDLSNIVMVQVFMVRPEKGQTIYIKRIWLE
jgi:hypothetical protein